MEYELEAAISNKPRLLLTAAVGAGEATIDTSYEVDKISPLLDFINLMTYDVNKEFLKIEKIYKKKLYNTNC